MVGLMAASYQRKLRLKEPITMRTFIAGMDGNLGWEFQPEAVIHFGECLAPPYSVFDRERAIYVRQIMARAAGVLVSGQGTKR
jgi:hypothetical protein